MPEAINDGLLPSLTSQLGLQSPLSCLIIEHLRGVTLPANVTFSNLLVDVFVQPSFVFILDLRLFLCRNFPFPLLQRESEQEDTFVTSSTRSETLSSSPYQSNQILMNVSYILKCPQQVKKKKKNLAYAT